MAAAHHMNPCSLVSVFVKSLCMLLDILEVVSWLRNWNQSRELTGDTELPPLLLKIIAGQMVK